MMRLHHIIRKALMGVLAIGLTCSLAGVNHHVNASSIHWIRITTNRDRLLMSKPGTPKRKSLGYFDHNKGALVGKIGSFWYKHRLYDEVVSDGSFGAQFPAYILAKSTNDPQRFTRGHVHSAHYKYGYWKHGRYHHYKTGYYLNGRWHYNVKTLLQRSGYLPKRSRKSRKGTWKVAKQHYSYNGPVANSQTWRNAVEQDEINLITQDRAQHGKAALHESPALDQIAQTRAKQTYQSNAMWNSPDPHVDQKTGQPYDDEVANQLGYSNLAGTMGENLAAGEEDPSSEQTAKGDNDMLYTQEEASDGGHYQNIIGEYDNASEDENYVAVGVGAYGDVLAEDFSFSNNALNE